MASASEKVSFTIRRPTPPESRGMSPAESSGRTPNFTIPALPRHLSTVSNGSTPLGSPLTQSGASSPQPHSNQEYDSSDEDEELQDQLVTGFDKFGVERVDGRSRRPKKVEPLVIAPLNNKDWRAIARKRRGHQYVPESSKAGTGADGSVGGLGTRETINTGPVVSGLQIRKREEVVKTEEADRDVVMDDVVQEEEQETEEQRALRALLAEAKGEVQTGSIIDAIPTPVTEVDALKQDIDELPESASLQDYERVPISQFGVAMLRGMGWKEGQAASRKPGKGMVEPYLPSARPALLGIGAKEREVLDDGSKRKPRKAPMKYIPLAKMERSDSGRDRDRSRSPVRSSTVSRRPSRSPSRRDKERSTRDDTSRRRDRDYERDREYERSTDKGRDRVRERNRDHHRDYDREKDWKRDYDRERVSDKSYRRSGSKESSKRRDY